MVSSRRRPWPYDIVLDGTGLMLGRPDKKSPLVATRPPDQSQVAPTDYGYSAQSPLLERIQPFEDMSGGLGLRMQEQFQDRRYYYAEGVDASIAGVWFKGPLVSTVTPATVDSTAGITHFYEVGGKLFALNGRYCHLRTADDDWDTGRKDFGNGKAATDVACFYSNAGGGAALAYIAMGDSEPVYKFDGTTYTQHAEAQKLYAIAFGVVGNEFYRAHSTNTLAKVDTDSDPFVIANWTADNAFLVGDKSGTITRMAMTATGALLVFKTDGVFTLGSLGDWYSLYPHLRLAASADNGKGHSAWLNDLYVPYSAGLYRIGSDFSISAVGPDKLTGNDSPVHGPITACVGHETFNLYAGIYNPDSGDSYLLKYGAWTENGQRLEAWHGSITPAFASVKITALHKSTIGAPTGHSRLYIGFSDGSIGWFTLPCTANPLACDEYTYETADTNLYLPTWHGGFQADPKAVRAATVTGKDIGADDYVQLEYKTDPADTSYSSLAARFDDGARTKVEFPDSTSGTLCDFKVILHNKTSGDTPQVTGLALHHAVRPPLYLIYQFSVLADSNVAKRDGSMMRLSADAIRDAVVDACNTAWALPVWLPDGGQKQLTFTDYSETQAWDDRTRKWRAAIAVKASENKSLNAYGTIDRLGDLTIDGLGDNTIDMLGVL